MSTTVPKVAVLLAPDEVGMLIEVASRERALNGEGYSLDRESQQRLQRMCDRILDACQRAFADYCAPKETTNAGE